MSKTVSIAALAAVLANLGAVAAAQDHAAHQAVHKVFTPADIKWGPGPAALPPGAQAAVLYGDPSKEGVFALRLKFPAGYRIAPHTHPKPEILTVISGSFRLGMGTAVDRASARALAPGTLSTMEPGTPHYGYAERETVLQINSVGPWAVNYVNPADDPRRR